MAANYYLFINQDGKVLGSGLVPELPLPISCIPCSQTQAQSWQECVVDLTTSPAAISIVAPTASVLLANAQKSQIETISAGCSAAITGGFSSSALGAAYTYPSKPTDQLNLLGSQSASLSPNLPTGWTAPFWCCDANGVWDIRPHTPTQIQQVFTDGVARKLACIEQNKSLANQVLAATTVAAVQAIVWVSP